MTTDRLISFLLCLRWVFYGVGGAMLCISAILPATVDATMPGWRGPLWGIPLHALGGLTCNEGMSYWLLLVIAMPCFFIAPLAIIDWRRRLVVLPLRLIVTVGLLVPWAVAAAIASNPNHQEYLQAGQQLTLLWGYYVYAVANALALIAIAIAAFLPRSPPHPGGFPVVPHAAQHTNAAENGGCGL